MGYDDGECVQCRLENHGGNVDTSYRAKMCLECMHFLSKDSPAMDHRLIQVLRGHLVLGEVTCYRCAIGAAEGTRDNHASISFDVSVCKQCCPDKKYRVKEYMW